MSCFINLASKRVCVKYFYKPKNTLNGALYWYNFEIKTKIMAKVYRQHRFVLGRRCHLYQQQLWQRLLC